MNYEKRKTRETDKEKVSVLYISLRVNEGMPKKRPPREKHERPRSTASVLRFHGRKIINIPSNCPATSIHVIPSSSLPSSQRFLEFPGKDA